MTSYLGQLWSRRRRQRNRRSLLRPQSLTKVCPSTLLDPSSFSVSIEEPEMDEQDPCRNFLVMAEGLDGLGFELSKLVAAHELYMDQAPSERKSMGVVQLEWTIRARELAQTEQPITLLRLLYKLRREIFPQLIININVLVRQENSADCACAAFLHDLTLLPEFQPSTTRDQDEQVFNIRLGRPAIGDLLHEIAIKVERGSIGVFGRPCTIARARIILATAQTFRSVTFRV